MPVNDGVGSALNIVEKDFRFCSVGWKRDAFWPFIFFSSSFPHLPPGAGPGPDSLPSFGWMMTFSFHADGEPAWLFAV